MNIYQSSNNIHIFFKPTWSDASGLRAPLSLSNLTTSGTTGGKMSLTAARVMSDQLTSCHVGWGGSSSPRGRRSPHCRSRVKFPTICVGIVESDGTWTHLVDLLWVLGLPQPLVGERPQQVSPIVPKSRNFLLPHLQHVLLVFAAPEDVGPHHQFTCGIWRLHKAHLAETEEGQGIWTQVIIRMIQEEGKWSLSTHTDWLGASCLIQFHRFTYVNKKCISSAFYSFSCQSAKVVIVMFLFFFKLNISDAFKHLRRPSGAPLPLAELFWFSSAPGPSRKGASCCELMWL